MSYDDYIGLSKGSKSLLPQGSKTSAKQQTLMQRFDEYLHKKTPPISDMKLA